MQTKTMSGVSRMPTGFPPLSQAERAKQYAAAARLRNKPECQCELCCEHRMLPAVLNIIEARKK